MTSKRDVNLVRLACRWRWLTAEQGEDCLALHRRLGPARTIEEIILRRGYLDAGELRELAAAADEAAGRKEVTAARRAPVAPPREQTVVRAVSMIQPQIARSRRPRPAAISTPPTAHRAPPKRGVVSRRPTSAAVERASTPVPDDPTRFDAPSPDVTRYEPLPAALRPSTEVTATESPSALGASDPWTEPEAPASSRGAIPAEVTRHEPGPWAEPEAPAPGRPAPEVTRYEPVPWFAQESPAPTRVAEVPDAAADGESWAEVPLPEAVSRPPSVPDPSQDRTVMGPLPEALLARLRGEDPPDAGDDPPTTDLGEAAPSGFDGPPTGSLSVPLVTAESPVPHRPPTGTVPLDAPPSVERPAVPLGPTADHRPRSFPQVELQVPLDESIEETVDRPADELGQPPPMVAPPPALPPELFAPVPVLEALDDADTGALEEPTADGYEQVSLLEVDGAAESLLGRFGPYELERIVARGRHSVVYLARDEGGRAVAVKVLGGDPDTNAKVLAARGDALLAAAQLAAPEVVRILDLGRVDARHYVTLEYVEGWNLAERLAFDEPPPAMTAFGWASQVSAALAAAQAKGLAHGDVRPERVLLSADQGARLGGFGFNSESAPGPYAPPEGPSVTPAADAYGLGAILFSALTGGAAPHEGLQHLPPLPDKARRLVESLLDADPDVRPTDFAGLAAALSAIAEPLAEVAPVSVEVARPSLPQVGLRTGIGFGVALALAVAAGLLGQTLAADGRALARLGLQVALAAAGLSGVATLLLGTLDLIRRGQLPLPTSAQWLVQLSEGAAAVGAAAAVLGGALGPPAYMNLLLAVLGGGLLLSAVFGVALRRAVARARPDGGVGRVLAVLSDPWLQRWRTVHGPALTVLFGLTVSRFAVLAYFSST